MGSGKDFASLRDVVSGLAKIYVADKPVGAVVSALVDVDETESAATWPRSWYLRHRSIEGASPDQAPRKEVSVGTAKHTDNDDGTDWIPDLFN